MIATHKARNIPIQQQFFQGFLNIQNTRPIQQRPIPRAVHVLSSRLFPAAGRPDPRPAIYSPSAFTTTSTPLAHITLHHLALPFINLHSRMRPCFGDMFTADLRVHDLVPNRRGRNPPAASLACTSAEYFVLFAFHEM